MADFYHCIGVISIVFCVFCLLWKILKGIWTQWLGSALGFGYSFKHSEDAFAVITGIGFKFHSFNF